MHLVAIAWIYVTLMMAVAEANSPDGSVTGALFTFVLYGVGPLAIVLYILGTPARRRHQRHQQQREAAHADPAAPQTGHIAEEAPSASGLKPDAGSHTAGGPVAAEREEP